MFYADERGAIAYLVGLLITVSVMMTGVAVDLGRIYAAESSAQRSLDAATLGSVITAGQTPVAPEFERLFYSNYTSGYMASTVTSLTIAETSPGIYTSSASLSIPRTLTSLFDSAPLQTTVNSQVSRGFSQEQAMSLEVALVLDSSTALRQQDLGAVKQASRRMVDIIFNNFDYLNNINISVVPYDVGVNIGTQNANWIQTRFRTQGQYYFDNPVLDALPLASKILIAQSGLAPVIDSPARPAFYGVASNRNWDDPRDNHEDASDAFASSDATQFRSPWHFKGYDCLDISDTSLTPLLFASSSRQTIRSRIQDMRIRNCTRINVGVLWGWMTLSPKWQNRWPSAPSSAVPRPYGAGTYKVMVIVSGGRNSVFPRGSSVIRSGSVTNPSRVNDDNEEMVRICQAMKSQGIKIYAIGIGDEVDVMLLRDCAGQDNYYYAPDQNTLENILASVGDDVVYNTIRLTK